MVQTQSSEVKGFRYWLQLGLYQLLVPLMVGILGSIIASVLTFNWLKQDLNSIIGRGLDIIMFDDTITEIDKSLALAQDFATKRPAVRLDNEVSAGAKDVVGGLETATSALVQECERLVVAFEKLQVSDAPGKLFDESIIASPRNSYSKRLLSLRDKAIALKNSVGQLEAELAAEKQIEARRRDVDFGNMHIEFNQTLAQIEKAKNVLVDRRDAFQRTLKEFTR